MCLDVFSIFDVYEFNSMMYDKRMVTVFMVLVPLILCAFLMITLWSFNFSFISVMKKIIKIMSDQCNRSTSYMLKGYSIIIISLFLVLISVNLFGLVSFSFSTSSHLLFTLMVGLPLWMSMILSGFMFSSKAFIAHLLPDGAPLWLNPFLVLIESVSIMVRPLLYHFVPLRPWLLSCSYSFNNYPLSRFYKLLCGSFFYAVHPAFQFLRFLRILFGTCKFTVFHCDRPPLYSYDYY
uniref:ATP synthase subunit a n=1 Tax=Whitmania laevis TaxID=307844 RepID=X2C882_WHILA|nr:ATP synthase F0 subunit 6 [Whitmania laevis]AGL34594.1 ATP synthase F0 subunit 6 [Whitmania laevis]